MKFLFFGAAAAAVAASVAVALRKRKPIIKLNYGNVAWWRAETIRIALRLGGIEFEDVRWQPYLGDEMYAAAKAAGVGHAPWLEVDGRSLFQTSAIARYCADVAGLTPVDVFLAAKVDEVIQSVTDLQTSFMMAVMEGGSGPKTSEFLEEQLPKWLKFFERLLKDNSGSGFFVGDDITIADIAVWRFIDQLDDAVMGKPLVCLFDGMLQAEYPLLAELYDRMWAHPTIKAYMDAQYPPGGGVNILKESSPVHELYPQGCGKWLSLDHDRRVPKPEAEAFWANRRVLKCNRF